MLPLQTIPPTIFWCLFFGLLALFFITYRIMSRQSKSFKFQRGVAITSFSIMDLEFPGNEASISKIVNGIHQLPEPLASKSLAALKGNLRVDFLFMAAVYPFIALLCYHTAVLMQHFGRWVFLGLAILQAVAWLFDILENIYQLHKIKKPYPAQPKRNKQYKTMVLLKWAFATTGLITAISAHFYFWATGRFSEIFSTIGSGMAIAFAILIFLGIILARTAFLGKSFSFFGKPNTEKASA